MNHTLVVVISFLILGIALGHILGVSRAAKRQSSAVNIKVDKLEIKVDDAAIVQKHDMSDMSDRIDEHHPEDLTADEDEKDQP